MQPRETADGGAAADLLQLIAQSLGGRHLEEGLRLNDAAVGGDTARQRFHPDDALLAHRENGLKVSGDRLRVQHPPDGIRSGGIDGRNQPKRARRSGLQHASPVHRLVSGATEACHVELTETKQCHRRHAAL
jgi:hypothetical protein